MSKPENQKATRPNIILLVADDLGWNDVGFHGSQIQTPHIDRLAAGGATLDQFYVMPSCTPTRASMLTGRYPIRYGLQVGVIKPHHRHGLPVDERILPQPLREAGYQTAIVGKWHLGLSREEYLPTSRGFDHQYGCYNGMIDYVRHTARMGMDWDAQLIDPQCMAEPTPELVGHDWNADDAVLYQKGYATDLIRDEAIRVIRERDRTRPLFLYVPFTAPHTPLQAKDFDLGPYEDREMAVPRIFRDEDEQQNARRQKRRRFYAALVSNMDSAIGKIVQTVEDEGISRETLIVFLSDNGGSYQGGNNDPLRGQKMSLYEGGVRVPAAMAYPGKIAPGTVIHSPMHAVDLYPTLLRLAGASLEQAKPLDGMDVWPILTTGAAPREREILLNARAGRSSAIRVGDWKLVRNGHLGPRRTLGDEPTRFELFNLRDDPCEKHNLVDRQPEQFEKLRARLEDYTRQAVPHLHYDLPAEREPDPMVWRPGYWENTDHEGTDRCP